MTISPKTTDGPMFNGFPTLLLRELGRIRRIESPRVNIWDQASVTPWLSPTAKAQIQFLVRDVDQYRKLVDESVEFEFALLLKAKVGQASSGDWLYHVHRRREREISRLTRMRVYGERR